MDLKIRNTCKVLLVKFKWYTSAGTREDNIKTVLYKIKCYCVERVYMV
jgi:hypothetical protein